MAEIDWFQSNKVLNYHNDIVLRTPTLYSGERIFLAAFRNPIDSFNSIMGIAYPEYGRKIPDCIGDLRLKANRNILATSNMSSLNGLFGIKQCSSMTNDENHNFGQLWAARTVHNCNLVEMPNSVIDLLEIGGNRSFNFVESLMP